MTIQLLGLAAGAFSAGLDILSFGRLASLVNRYLHIYGPIGLFIPFLASAEVFRLVEQVLWETNDAVALQFLGNQLQQINMVAVTVCPHIPPYATPINSHQLGISCGWSRYIGTQSQVPKWSSLDIEGVYPDKSSFRIVLRLLLDEAASDPGSFDHR